MSVVSDNDMDLSVEDDEPPPLDDAPPDSDCDPSTSVPVAPPPKKKRRKYVRPGLYYTRKQMCFNRMKEGSPHSHRQHEKRKPKVYLPHRDKEFVEHCTVLRAEGPYCYNSEDLGFNPHFSEPVAREEEVVEKFRDNNIPVTIVDFSSQGDDGKAHEPTVGLTVRYPRSSLMQDISRKAPGLEDELLDCLISMHNGGKMVEDRTREQVSSFRRDINKKRRIMARLRFGWGQGQGVESSAYREYKGIGIPSLKVESFSDNLSSSLQGKMYWLFHLAAEEVRKENPGALGDDLRSSVFGNLFRKELGCSKDDPLFPWEYIDVLVSCDTALARHCDHLNDWRHGYNHTSVYSYHRTVDGAEYKVSVIMATRKSVGKAVERIRDAGVE